MTTEDSHERTQSTVIVAATPRESPRILCVDDEVNVLAGLRDNLRRHFEVVTASDGVSGIDALRTKGPFAVVVSDFAMPGMNGAEFLAQACLIAPRTVRMLLTGHASVESAIAALNEGNIFRFLTKPCSPEDLVRALQDAIEQARLVTADRALLESKLENMSGCLVRAERLASLGTMAGAVGHELNNVLSVFVGALEFIQEDAVQGRPPTREDLDSLQHVQKHLTTHARNLLRLGRPDEGRTDVADLRETVEGAIAMLGSGGLLRHIALEARLPRQKLVVSMTQTEVEQIVVNLVKNAIDATDEARVGEPKIVIEVDEAEGGTAATCSVRDNGIGIPEASLGSIFAPYFTTKPSDRGTGLGLFVVKQIVERAGGAVRVDSQSGVGTRFTFTVPIAGLSRATSGMRPMSAPEGVGASRLA